MGKWLTCLRRLTLAQLRPTLWPTSERTCRRDIEFSHRPDGELADISYLYFDPRLHNCGRCSDQQQHVYVRALE